MRLVELSRAMNHVFIREAGGVGDNPGHSKSRGRAAHCQVASDSVRQRKEARRILGALTSTGCHIERIGRLDEKIHACVVCLSHFQCQTVCGSRPGKPTASHWDPSDSRSCRCKRRRWCSKSAPLRGYTRRCRLRTPASRTRRRAPQYRTAGHPLRVRRRRSATPLVGIVFSEGQARSLKPASPSGPTSRRPAPTGRKHDFIGVFGYCSSARPAPSSRNKWPHTGVQTVRSTHG